MVIWFNKFMGKFIKTPSKCYFLPFRFILEGKVKEEIQRRELYSEKYLQILDIDRSLVGYNLLQQK